MKTYAVRSLLAGREIRVLTEDDKNRFMKSGSWEVIASGEDLPPAPSRASFDRASARFNTSSRTWTCGWQGGNFNW